MISLAVSKNIFNELKAKGFLDSKNYFTAYSDDFVADYSANPAAYPVISGLTGWQKLFVEEQISCAVADHHFYSDLNKTTLRFLNRQCN